MPMATAASFVALAAVLVMVASGKGPDVIATVPVAMLVVAVGLVSLDDVRDVFDRLGPTLAFLAAIFVVAEIAELAGLFARAGGRLARNADTSTRLVVVVSAAAIVVTVLMSLDATAVLFTPVVIGVVRARRAEPSPSLLVTTQLANAASSFLPVSNLTNLLVFSATGLSFGGFAVRMAVPTAAAAAVVVGTVVIDTPRDALSALDAARPTPMDAFGALVIAAIALLTTAFFCSSVLGVEPAWIAVAGAVLLAAIAIATGRARPLTIARATSPMFLLFVFGLALVVQAAVDHGLHDVAVDVLPSGDSLLTLLAMAGLAALLANLVNNLPATLVLVSVVPAGSTALLLALLIGVNVGPNLSYTGSLATLLWRRVVRRDGVEPTRRAFFRLAVLTTPAALIAATVGLWLTLRAVG
jgi:arsenical pump membrane protein